MKHLHPGQPTQQITISIVDWQEHSESLSRVRREVFIEEQGVPREMEWDGLDLTAIHFLATDKNGLPVATARLQNNGKVGRMAVLKAWRQRGVGTAMMRQVIETAGQQQQPLYLHAQLSAESFYRQFGFQRVGEPFDEAGIPHVHMRQLWKEPAS